MFGIELYQNASVGRREKTWQKAVEKQGVSILVEEGRVKLLHKVKLWTHNRSYFVFDWPRTIMYIVAISQYTQDFFIPRHVDIVSIQRLYSNKEEIGQGLRLLL